MSRRGSGYGSEDHLRRYLAERPEEITDKVAVALGVEAGNLEWLPFPRTPKGDRELRGLEFLQGQRFQDVRTAWAHTWPATGRQPSWDAVAHAGDAWILLEAKSNVPEFVSPPCSATPASREQIVKALNQTKRLLGVTRFLAWNGTYYQYANRLTVLRFLHEHGVLAHLVFVYITGDRFPDGTPCPASPAEWEPLIEARRLTLGLPETHALSGFDHHIFLDALGPSPEG
jgi:hypothetical protein